MINLHVFELVEEAEENSTLKVPGQESNWGPSCCETSELTNCPIIVPVKVKEYTVKSQSCCLILYSRYATFLILDNNNNNVMLPKF